MKFKPGCGCVILVLAGLNVFFAGSILYGMATGSTSIGISLFSLAIFAGNVAVCFRMGVTEIKAGGHKDSGEAGEGEGQEESEEITTEDDN
jgi:hypothetical protein